MKRFFFLIVMLILISFLIHNYKFNSKYSDQLFSKEYTIEVLDKLKETTKYNSYLVKLNNDNFLLNVYDKNNNYLNGDEVIVNSYILIPKTNNNLYEFNYRMYLNSQNIVGVISTKKSYKTGSKNTLFRYVQVFREYLDYNISKNFDAKKASFLKTVMYSEDIDKDILEEFTKIGINHVLSISGFNIYLLSCILNLILKKLKYKKVKIIIKGIVYIFYLILSSFRYIVIKIGNI